MPIHPIDRFRATEGPQSARRSSPADAEKRPSGASSDGIEISEEARSQLQFHEVVSSARAAAAAAPEVRQDRVDLARQRVQEGYYERPEVRGSIVDALLSAFRSE
jgi:hypothetical protein